MGKSEDETDKAGLQAPTLDSIKALLSSDKKGDQQKGLLQVRDLATSDALKMLLYSIRTTKNDFIQASATVAIGELDLAVDLNIQNMAIATLAELLATAEDYSIRAAAAAGMGYATEVEGEPRQSMVEALCRALLEDGEWQVQFSCLASLGVLANDDDEIVDTIMSWLRNDNDLIVQAAVGALGDLKNVRALPGLLGLLGANDMMTRQRLAQALGAIPECASQPAAIDALRTLKKDQSFVVRDSATESLRALGVTQSNIVKEYTDELSEEDMIDLEVGNILQGDEAGNASESAKDALRRRLERSFSTEWSPGQSSFYNSDETAGAANHIGVDIKNEADSSKLQSKEDSTLSENKVDRVDEPTQRTKLGRRVDAKEWRQVVDTMKHGNDKDRVLAAIELREFEVELGKEAVREADGMNPDVSPVRVRSVCAGLLGDAGDIEGLVNSLQNDPDQNVRSTCCDALVDAGGGDVAIDACIDRLLHDAHWLVRISAAIALGSIGKGVERVVAVLIDCVRQGIADVDSVQEQVIQRHAVTALGFLGATQAVAAFDEIASRPDIDEAVRYRVAAALSGIACEESVQLAMQLASDENDFVAEMAQSSLDALAKSGFGPTGDTS